MKLSQLKQIIQEEIQNSLKEAPKSSTLKDLDFNKFDQILQLVTTPLTTATLDLDEYEGYEGSTISGYKKVKEIEYIAKFLKKFSELYKANSPKAMDLLDKESDTIFTICDDDDSAEMLKDKKLAKALTDVNEALSSLMYSVPEMELDYVAKDYNKLADVVAKFGLENKKPSPVKTVSKATSSPAKTYTGSDMAKLVNSPDFDQKYVITTNADGAMVITPKK